ncbi:hypothetical protein HGRIS_008881 [Hohenbuehelia grisea]|uniref:Endo-1,4-beta-xylanase n=1 Tax=Hohenbuehelia grisea TaxID=104357 RepID=A0ABR3IZU0_9AGAR
MVSFYRLLTTATILVSAHAGPENPTETLQARGVPPNSGYNGSFYYTWWSDGDTQAVYTNSAAGQYSLQWLGDTENVLGGKGWNPGTFSRQVRSSSRQSRPQLAIALLNHFSFYRVINYSRAYRPNGDSSFSIYGWTRYPLIEYYIVESFGTSDPSRSAQKQGTLTCNGASYDILQTTKLNQTSIDGTQTFQQFWSVRTPKKAPSQIIGSVDVACHFKGWANAGMNLGSSFSYQIVATEGHQSSGSAIVMVA